MKLNDFFSKIYCINLDSRPDKYEICASEFEKFGIEVERVSGIDGNRVIKPSGENVSNGAYGLWSTHIKLIEEAIKNKYENILIFEDDVAFIDDFPERFNAKVSELPMDWDLFYLGGNTNFDKAKISIISGDEKHIPNKENYKKLEYEICKTTWIQTTHAVGINIKFYETLLNEYQNKPIKPIDVVHCHLQQNGCNTYCFLPSLVIQRPTFSDIENTYVDYGKMDNFNF